MSFFLLSRRGRHRLGARGHEKKKAAPFFLCGRAACKTPLNSAPTHRQRRPTGTGPQWPWRTASWWGQGGCGRENRWLFFFVEGRGKEGRRSIGRKKEEKRGNARPSLQPTATAHGWVACLACAPSLGGGDGVSERRQWGGARACSGAGGKMRQCGRARLPTRLVRGGRAALERELAQRPVRK